MRQAGADLKFTNNRKENALAVAEAYEFELGVEILRKANVDNMKDARDRKQGRKSGAGAESEKKTTEEDFAKAQAAASESKSQFVVVNTTLQGSADAATGSAGAARAVVAGLHLGPGAKNPPAVRASSSAAARTRRRRPRGISAATAARVRSL